MEGNQAVAGTAVESGHTAHASTSAYLRLEQVVKRFGATAAVDQVSLGIPRGAFATLLGPSGCGKTTLLRLIAGFHDPDGGAIYLDEQRIDHLPAHKRGAAMVFQDTPCFHTCASTIMWLMACAWPGCVNWTLSSECRRHCNLLT